MSGIVTRHGLTASWRLDGEYVTIEHAEYKKAPMKLLPAKTAEQSALWMLDELNREIKLGAARKR